MSRRARLTLFALAGPGLLAVLVIGLHGLPPFGDYHGVYGATVDRVELAARHATDYVTALNFDLRTFDTLGEEFILFGSVTGVAVILRHIRDQDDDVDRRTGLDEHRFAGASDSLRLLSLFLIPSLTVLGVYLVLHGALTPGGGFQGGVVLAAGPIAIMLAGRYLALKRLAPQWALETLEGAGAGAYTLIGVGGLIFGAVFFENFLPYGTAGTLLSAGTVPLNSIAVGLEVTGAFLLTFTEFLDQSLLTTREEQAP
ncbi:MAG TPA: MnhB domain-containing protein [Solirubrobacteraceae bacterium]|nr:MnhB domain-containing protein [Solirubrobacteraceae bacterium]